MNMSIHKLFQKFDTQINLDNPKRKELKQQRKSIRDQIHTYFTGKSWSPPGFSSQGSFPLGTDLNPLPGDEYDLDDGVYFICPTRERMTPDAYHGRVKRAIKERTPDIKDKDTCIRVIYADGHHIDFPIYWTGDLKYVPLFADKRDNYTESDPVDFMNWVKARIGGNEQLRRIIRYLKAWADWREYSNANLKLPSGFILTILACNHYSHAPGRDDVAFTKTVMKIFTSLSTSFKCYRPTAPTKENVLVQYDKSSCLKELKQLCDNAHKASNAARNEDACIYWLDAFGARFIAGALDLNPSHRQKPESRWKMRIEYNVSLSASFKYPNRESEKPFPAGKPLDKELELFFRARTNAPKGFTVYWQVVNTGTEAQRAGDLRGEISQATGLGRGGLIQKEGTKYSGIHWIECFIVVDNMCIARSGEFIVRIK